MQWNLLFRHIGLRRNALGLVGLWTCGLVACLLCACGENRSRAYYYSFSQNLWNVKDTVIFTTDTCMQGTVLTPRFSLRCAAHPKADFQNIVIEVTQVCYEVAHKQTTNAKEDKETRYTKDTKDTIDLPPYFTHKDTFRLALQDLQKGMYSPGVSLKARQFHLPSMRLEKDSRVVFRVRHLMRKEDIAACADLSLQLQ